MTEKERRALQEDLQNPVDLFTLVVRNNPTAISNNFQAWGYTYGNSSQKEMVGELLRLWGAGGEHQDQAIKLVSVPYQFNVLPSGFDLVITGEQAPLMKNTGGEQGAWYTDIDWGDIIGNIFGGVDGIINGGTGDSPGPGYGPGPGAGDDDDDKPDYTQWAIVGGVGLLIVVVLVVALKD